MNRLIQVVPRPEVQTAALRTVVAVAVLHQAAAIPAVVVVPVHPWAVAEVYLAAVVEAPVVVADADNGIGNKSLNFKNINYDKERNNGRMWPLLGLNR